MNHPENFAKKIKKHLYGKPQSIQAVFPAGFYDTAMTEIQTILNHLWFPQKYRSECTQFKKFIRIDNIHVSAITELLMRSQSLADIRLIIFEGKAAGKEMFKKKALKIQWPLFLDKQLSLKIQVNSIASRAFHETGLKIILSDMLKEYVKNIVSGTSEVADTTLYVDLYQDRLTISISLAGELLYKRGYRQVLQASAPLREDAAFCCLKKSLEFSQKINNAVSPDVVLVPFSGTGTFAFEYLQYYFNFSPILFARDFALQKMPFFRQESFQFLLKKAQESFLNAIDKKSPIHFYCIDQSSSANLTFKANEENVKKSFARNGFSLPDDVINNYEEDFFKIDLFEINQFSHDHVFMPLNPPYGIRLGKNIDSINFYKKIAMKINEFAEILRKSKKTLSGFILCPDEKTWSIFCKTLTATAVAETYHFTQGGLDIRVCQFFIE